MYNDQFETMKQKHFETDCVFVHTCFMSLFSGMLNWISDVLYPRFNYKVITTYDKAVEVFTKKMQNPDGEVQNAFLPALTLDPVLDFSNEERAGRFLWMFKNLDAGKKNNWNTIKLTDQGVTITPMFTRYQGTVEITAWFTSIYELMDFRTKVIQYCGGYQRWIRPDCFWTHLILPKQIIDAEGPNGAIDWNGINPEIITLQTTTTKEYALPFQLDAIWRLDSFSDASNKMGADQIAEYKQTATFTWECNIPTWIRFDNYQYPIHGMQINVGTTPAVAKYPLVMGYDTYTSLDLYDMLPIFCKYMPIYNIVEDGLAPLLKCDGYCKSSPDKYVQWNHYVIGSIYDIKRLEFPDDIKKHESVLLIDEYKEEYLPFIRKCRGLICLKNNNESELLNTVNDYGISCIFDISDSKLISALKSIHGRLITFDCIGQMIYDGPVKIKLYKETDDFKKFIFNHNTIKIIREYNLSEHIDNLKKLPVGSVNFQTNLVYDKGKQIARFTARPNQYIYKLDCVIHNSLHNNIKVMLNDTVVKNFTIDGFNIVLNGHYDIVNGDIISIYIDSFSKQTSVNLVCQHKMSKQDELDYYSNKKLIEIDLNSVRNIDLDSIQCISYNGLMNRDIDYIVDTTKKIIVFNLEPRRDCYIEIYGSTI